MKKTIPFLIVFIILCVSVSAIALLALTNPSEAMHTRTIVTYSGRITGQQFGGYEGGVLGQMFGQLLGNLANYLGVTPFEYHNYVIFSTMTSGDQLISFGILENVKIVAPDSFFKIKYPAILNATIQPPLMNTNVTEVPNMYTAAAQTVVAQLTKVAQASNASGALEATQAVDANQGSSLQQTAQAYATQQGPSMEQTVQAFATQQGPGLEQTVQAFATQSASTSGQAPEDIPQVEGEKTGLVTSETFVTYFTSMDFKSVVSFYEKQMAANGWTKVDNESTQNANSAVLVFGKSTRKATVTLGINPTNNSTVVVITISHK